MDRNHSTRYPWWTYLIPMAVIAAALWWSAVVIEHRDRRERRGAIGAISDRRCGLLGEEIKGDATPNALTVYYNNGIGRRVRASIEICDACVKRFGWPLPPEEQEDALLNWQMERINRLLERLLESREDDLRREAELDGITKAALSPEGVGNQTSP